MELASRIHKRTTSAQLSPTSSSNPKRPRHAPSHRERPADGDDFHVAIFCALPLEAVAVRAVLDHCWDTDGGAPYERASSDRNAYTTGVVGKHHVVVVHMPGIGKSQAAQAAADCVHTFRNIELALLVGICGGVPLGSGSSTRIFLGDVVVSEYVVQYDFGRKVPDGLRVKNTGVDSLEKPNAKIRSCVSKIKSDTTIGTEMAGLLSALGDLSVYPGASNDKLFAPSYRHKHQKPTACLTCAKCLQKTDPACDESMGASCAELGCDESNLMLHGRFLADDGSHRHTPSVHYGTYASGDVVMRSGDDRDEIAKCEKAIAFEMEAPGVLQSFPGRTIIIKGVCDYADSHKNKLWQRYAATTAAAYMKVFLSRWASAEKRPSRTAPEANMLQDEMNQRCLFDLRLTDPSTDKGRIEKTKGGLFRDASKWILDHRDFHRWLESEETKLLWVKGDPGKGKTMLIITIIDELERRVRLFKDRNEPDLVAYFFCQGTNKDLNHGTSALRGLIYLLIRQHPPLISYLRAAYDHAGSRFFEDGNAFFALSQVLQNMLGDQNRPRVYLIIDALDECWKQQELLLDLVSENAERYSRAKWIFSSRNEPEIERHFTLNSSGIKMVLEIQENAEQITQAVNAYVDFRIQELRSLTQDEPQRIQVRDILREKADGTFLWVALAIKEVRNSEPWCVVDDLQRLPRDLDDLYTNMVARVRELPSHKWELCQRMLSTVVVAYRPLHIAELGVLSEMPQSIRKNTTYLKSVVALCGSFLTIQSDDTVYILHQSAADYLNGSGKAAIFPDGQAHVHQNLYIQSLEEMTAVLKQNIYNLPHPGSFIKEAQIIEDPLLSVRYSLIHWVDHFEQMPLIDESFDVRTIYAFFESKLLNWFEALCLIDALPIGLLAIAKLKRLLMTQAQQSQLLALVQDALRFLQYFKVGIMNNPLQIYASGLLFCPKNSMIRSLCQEFQPNWIHQPPAIPNDWSICEHILEGHTDWNTTVDYSPDGKLLASASADGTIRIWRTDTGICDQVLEGHGSTVMSAAFSPDGSRIVSGCDTGDIWVWRATQGAYRFERVLIKHEASTRSVAFSSDGTRLAASFNDGTVRIWRSNARFYEHEQTFGDHGKATSNGQESLATYLTFSSDGGRLAVAFLDGPVEIWRADDAAYKFERCFQGTAMFPAVAFSPDGSNLALGLTENNIHIFRLDTWTHEHILKVDTDDIDVLAFSPDGKWLVCGSRSIYIWRIEAGCYGLEQTLKGVSGIQTTSLAFSPDSAWLASTSQNKDVRIWRIDTGNHDNEIEGDLLMICSVTFSPDGLRLASASHDGLIRIWGVQTGVCERIIDDSDSIGPQVAFSSDGLRFASSHMKGDIRIWRVRDWVHEQLFNVGETGNRISLAFSPGGTCLAVVYSDCHVMILQIETGVCVQRFMTTCDLIRAIAFSPDGARLALASSKFRNGCQSWTIQVWRLSTESCVQKLQIYHHDNWVDEKRMTFSPDGQQLRTAQSAMRIFPSKVPEVYYGGFDVSKDRRWITWNGTPILWLPADYQGAYSAVSGSRIALGLDSGRVITLALDPQLMDALLAQVNLQQSSREEWEKGIFDVSLPNESLDAEEGSEEDGESYEEGGSDEEGVSDEVGHYHEY